VRIVGNLLWFVLHGLWAFLAYVFIGFLWCLTIVGIPFGLASFRLATFVIWPFGRTVVHSPTRGAASGVGNLLWFFLAGLWIAFVHVVGGLLLCLTIIGIPFGVQAFKLAGLAIAPLGRQIVRIRDLPAAAAV
jgi:uncharacterized membrane protein YccF (DUF307 family)